MSIWILWLCQTTKGRVVPELLRFLHKGSLLFTRNLKTLPSSLFPVFSVRSTSDGAVELHDSSIPASSNIPPCPRPLEGSNLKWLERQQVYEVPCEYGTAGLWQSGYLHGLPKIFRSLYFVFNYHAK